MLRKVLELQRSSEGKCMIGDRKRGGLSSVWPLWGGKHLQDLVGREKQSKGCGDHKRKEVDHRVFQEMAEDLGGPGQAGLDLN